jgi:tRNA pseudouridine55 synthase
MNKILPVYKPVGLSSFDMIRVFKKQNNPNYKVGHGGTLDPFACGLLLLLLGEKTKEFDKIKNWKKVYLAGVRLGMESASQDISTKITNKRNVVIPRYREIENVLNEMVGEFNQVVSPYSAAKHEGKKLYELAKKGVIIKKEKKIRIDKIEIIAYHYPLLTIRVHTYGGTYIRQLTEDIGKKLNSGALLYFLERERIGKYSINKAQKIL